MNHPNDPTKKQQHTTTTTTMPRLNKRYAVVLGLVLFIAFLLVNESLFLSSSSSIEAETMTTIQSKKSSRLVVSMSSFPGRMGHLKDTIASLESQSLVPDTIYVFVPHQVNRLSLDDNKSSTSNSSSSNTGNTSSMSHNTMLDPDILALNSSSRVHILWMEKDYGPSTKLLGALLYEKQDDTIIITVDDDMVYHPHTIETLVQSMFDHPNTAPCFICEFYPWWTRFWNGPAVRQFWQGLCHGWSNAFAAVAFRRSYFDDSIFDYSQAPKGCQLHDDVWISGHLFLKGIRPYNLRPGFDSKVKHFRHPSLSINAVKNGESEYRNPCIAHFQYFGL